MAPRTANAQALDGRCSRGTRSFRCRICRGIHPLRKCNRFLRLSAEKRLRAVLINKYCSNCLAHQHSGQSCRSKDKCRKCGQEHHTLLHMHERSSAHKRQPRSFSHQRRSNRQRSPSTQERRSRHPRSSSKSRSSTPDLRSRSRSGSPTLPSHPIPATDQPPNLASLLQHKSTNVLPTALVSLEMGERKYVMQALFDTCSAVSAISASLASTLKLQALPVGEDKVCTATVASRINPELRFEVLLKIVEGLHIRTPLKPLGDSVQARFANLTLADESFHRPSSIFLVLGADVANHVIREGFMPSQNGLPLAQNTIFGWMVSGSCSC